MELTRQEKAALFRKRFFGRQDVYGRKWTNKEGNSGYAPVCSNIWTDGCHLKLKDGVSCTDCKIKKYDPVSDQSVLKHIEGDEEQIQYVLLPNENVWFGAIDFDCKPGKEELGYGFEHVKSVLNVLKEWGIPYGVARSTTAGFHVYIFLAEEYPAYRLRSIWLEILELAGILEYSKQGLKGVPEIFPKQSSGGVGGLGNGIKPPMIEPSMKTRERNCWVDDENRPIPMEFQWAHFKNIKSADPKHLEDLITKHAIPIIELPKGSGKGHQLASAGREGRSSSGNHKTTGSAEKVMEGCTALKRVRDKALKGEKLTHFEGFGLYHTIRHTVDGRDWFIKHSGWGTTDSDMRQLEHSDNKDYSPWTCRKLQETGVCVAGTKCFDKKPPIDTIEGQSVVRDDLPESEWPDPSPIRYAHQPGTDFLNKLCAEVEALKDEKETSKVDGTLKEIAKRAQVFDSGQQNMLKEHIIKNKIAKTRVVNKYFDEAFQEAQEQFKKISQERSDSIVFGGEVYRKNREGGYSLVKRIKGQQEQTTFLSNFTIEIKEEKTLIDDEDNRKKVLCGTLTFPNKQFEFTIETHAWRDPKEFWDYFKRLAGVMFHPRMEHLESIKIAAEEFSIREKSIKHSTFYSVQGWYGNMFLMPSVVIDKEGVRPNTEKPVDLAGKELAKLLDFKILPDDEFRSTLLHLKTDFLAAFPRKMAFLGLAHAFQPPLMHFIEGNQGRCRPFAWFEGLTGNGKSGLCWLLQQFYGKFPSLLMWTTTFKSLMDYGHNFRDCLLVIDDYKEVTAFIEQTAKQAIQYSYEQGVRGAMNRNGQQRGDKNPRCLFMSSGEETPSNDASVIARTVLGDYPKTDKALTSEKFNTCHKMSENYCGITPKFIHWILLQDKEALNEDLEKIKNGLIEPIRGRQNDTRVTVNLALNFLTFKLFLGFMAEYGAITPKEQEQLHQEAYTYIEEVRDAMIVRCSEEQNGVILLNTLRELILTKQVSIRNLAGFDHEKVREIAYVKPGDGRDSRIAYFHGISTREVVLNNLKNTSVRITLRNMLAQFVDLGVVVPFNDRDNTTVVRGEDGRTERRWAVDLVKLGITNEPLQSTGSTQRMDLPPPPPLNADGIL